MAKTPPIAVPLTITVELPENVDNEVAVIAACVEVLGTLSNDTARRRALRYLTSRYPEPSIFGWSGFSVDTTNGS